MGSYREKHYRRGQVSPTSLFVPSDKKLHETKAKTILYKSIPTLPSVPTVMFKVPDYGTLTSGSFLKGPILRAASVGLISGSEWINMGNITRSIPSLNQHHIFAPGLTKLSEQGRVMLVNEHGKPS